jgi:hypothetical protein
MLDVLNSTFGENAVACDKIGFGVRFVRWHDVDLRSYAKPEGLAASQEVV